MRLDMRFDEAHSVGVPDVQCVRQAERVVESAVTKTIASVPSFNPYGVEAFFYPNGIVDKDRIDCRKVVTGLLHPMESDGVHGGAVVKS